MPWKIKFTNEKTGATRVIYSALTNRDDVAKLAHEVTKIITYYNGHKVIKLSERSTQELPAGRAEIKEWNPDHPDSDGDSAVALETAIMWALGRDY